MAGTVASRLGEQLARLHAAARACGRDPSEVRLLAVSKFQPTSAILEAYAAGQRDFGENYVQELTAKAEQLAHLADLRWHLIGHLQSNKVKAVASIATSVQTIDSARLARELGKRRGTTSALDVLVEVNVGGEASKSGCSPEALADVLAAVEAEPTLRLRGLLTIPPATAEPAQAGPHFDELRRLRDVHGGRGRLPELSMGMSADLEVAVAHGSTWVRIGSAIFGERPQVGSSPAGSRSAGSGP